MEEDTGRSNSGRFCSDRADGVSRVGLALVHSEAGGRRETVPAPQRRHSFVDKQELTSHFHGEDDDSNLGGMPRKCPSKACFLQMPPELLWKRRNVEGGEKGSPRQRMASLKTDVCTTGAGGGGHDGKRGCV